MPRGGAISQTERVRLAEDAVLKTVAPAMVSKVRVLGAPLFSRPCSSTDLERSSPKGSDASATLVRDTSARTVQKQHGRLSIGRPRSITGCGCHFHSLDSSKGE